MNLYFVDRHDITIRMFVVFVEASVTSRYFCMSEEHESIVDARVCEIEDEMDEDEDENDETSRIRFSYFFEEMHGSPASWTSVDGH